MQSMSGVDLCKIKERSHEKFKSCDCTICTTYQQEDLSCDLKRVKNTMKTTPSSDVTKRIQETYRSQTENYLRYVDSIQLVYIE